MKWPEVLPTRLHLSLQSKLSATVMPLAALVIPLKLHWFMPLVRTVLTLVLPTG
jgi:hypothetical protein